MRGRGDIRGRSGRASPWLRPAGNLGSRYKGRSGPASPWLRSASNLGSVQPVAASPAPVLRKHSVSLCPRHTLEAAPPYSASLELMSSPKLPVSPKLGTYVACYLLLTCSQVCFLRARAGATVNRARLGPRIYRL